METEKNTDRNSVVYIEKALIQFSSAKTAVNELHKNVNAGTAREVIVSAKHLSVLNPKIQTKRPHIVLQNSEGSKVCLVQGRTKCETGAMMKLMRVHDVCSGVRECKFEGPNRAYLHTDRANDEYVSLVYFGNKEATSVREAGDLTLVRLKIRTANSLFAIHKL